MCVDYCIDVNDFVSVRLFFDELLFLQIRCFTFRVMTQVSCEVTPPKQARPSEGILFLNVELSPMAAPHFEVGRYVFRVMIWTLFYTKRACFIITVRNMVNFYVSNYMLCLQTFGARHRNISNFGTLCKRIKVHWHGVAVYHGWFKGEWCAS